MRNRVRFFLVSSVVCCVAATWAPAPGQASPELVPVAEQCVVESAAHHRVPVSLIMWLMAQEDGAVGMVSDNTNGSYDIGPMQINSWWLPKLKRLGVSEKSIRDNGCINVAVGTWIFSDLLRRYPVWQAIGYYHTGETSDPAKANSKAKLADKYIRSLVKKAQQIDDPRKIITRANRSIR